MHTTYFDGAELLNWKWRKHTDKSPQSNWLNMNFVVLVYSRLCQWHHYWLWLHIWRSSLGRGKTPLKLLARDLIETLLSSLVLVSSFEYMRKFGTKIKASVYCPPQALSSDISCHSDVRINKPCERKLGLIRQNVVTVCFFYSSTTCFWFTRRFKYQHTAEKPR